MHVTDGQKKSSTPRWRRVSGAALVALGAVLAPVAILSGWAIGQVTDTDRFVATFAPLGSNDEVQSAIAGRVSDAIDEQLDLEAVIAPFFDELTADFGPVGSAGAQAIEGLVVQGARQLIDGAVHRVVESDGFSVVWEEALRASHGTLVAVLDDESQVLTMSDDGTLGIELGPIVERVKASLVDGGLGFASAIPEIDRTIPLVTSESLVTLRNAYAVANAVGFWLPWLVVALLVGGILLAGAGLRSLVFSAGGVAVAMLLLLIGIGIGRAVAIHEIDALGLSPVVAGLVFDQVIGDIVVVTVWVLVAVLVVGLGAVAIPRLRRWWARRNGAVEGAEPAS